MTLIICITLVILITIICYTNYRKYHDTNNRYKSFISRADSCLVNMMYDINKIERRLNSLVECLVERNKAKAK